MELVERVEALACFGFIWTSCLLGLDWGLWWGNLDQLNNPKAEWYSYFVWRPHHLEGSVAADCGNCVHLDACGPLCVCT